MAKAYQYTADGYFAGEVEDYGLLPNNATYTAPPKQPWNRVWPQWIGNVWAMVDDHRERQPPLDDIALAQDAPDFWLPDDTHPVSARHMTKPGPLPDGALTERPAKTASELLVEAKAAKTAEIAASYDAAVAASLTMPTASPTAQDITIGAADFASEDAEGFTLIMTTHAARRNELLAAVEAAETAEAVQAIAVSYAV